MKSLSKKVAALKRRKLVAKKVIDIAEFRDRTVQGAGTVLVVDDDEVARGGLKRILESSGYRVLLAQDGLELSKVLESTALDLVLLDINLPWVDGLELCRLIKGHENLARVPLVLVSGRKEKDDLVAGFAAGCDDYVTKPFDIDHMLNVVAGQLQGSDPSGK